jgi:adenylate kinase
MKKIVVMGPPGSGKSTQAELLAKKLNLPHLQTGQMYRRIAKINSDLGKKVKNFLSKGHLVPDEEHNQILKKEVSRPQYRQGFVLDGSPRTLNQAETLPFGVDKVFYLKVSDEETTKRLVKRGREDDEPEVIKERLKVYHQQTEPILAYYREMGVLEEVDGEKPIEPIFEDIVERLEK